MAIRLLPHACLSAAILMTLSDRLARADELILNANHDNTLSQDQPSNSNGLSDIYAGRIRTGGRRHGLISFDLSTVPPAATITSVKLSMVLAQGRGTRNVFLHRCLKTWGEGTSSGFGGQGDPADPGEATWIANRFGISNWTTAGGDYTPTASATTLCDAAHVNIYYHWTSAAMVNDVNFWRANPASNFGWFVIGTETVAETAMRFLSRESTEGPRPYLTITYTMPSVSCQPADIADDAGNPLPSLGDNTGVNEGDYNAFFAGFFNAAAVCNHWDDAGNPLPSAGDNTGVNEGDYNGFFATFFNGCP